MSNNKCIKPVTAAIGAVLLGCLCALNWANAEENPFGASRLERSSMVLASDDEKGRCGEGKEMKHREKEANCGGGKAMEHEEKKAKYGGGKEEEHKEMEHGEKESRCGGGRCGGK
jgi:hypothetical protein